MHLKLVRGSKDFFTLLEALVDKIDEGARELLGLFEDFDRGDERLQRIVAFAVETDEIEHEIVSEIRAAPEAFLDHRDLYRLSSSLSSVFDEMKAAAECIDLFHVPESIPQVMGMAEMLARATELTSQAARDLRNVNTRIDSLHEYVTSMKALKDAADQQHRRTRRALYEGDFNVMAVLSYRDTLKSIGLAIGRLEGFARIIESIAVRAFNEEI